MSGGCRRIGEPGRSPHEHAAAERAPGAANGPQRADPGRGRVRRDFPILSQTGSRQSLVFLDSAASAQKPRAVIDAIENCYEANTANVHRGVYWLSAARHPVRRRRARRLPALPQRPRGRGRSSSPAAPPRRSTSWPAAMARASCKAGDEVIISAHGASLQYRALADAADRKGIVLKVVPIDDARRAPAGRVREAARRRAPSWSPSPTCPTRWARSTR